MIKQLRKELALPLRAETRVTHHEHPNTYVLLDADNQCLAVGLTKENADLIARIVNRQKRNKSAHPLYYTWTLINHRCTCTSCDKWKYYGGKGIRVCERWRKSFDVFLADMGSRPSGHYLRRVDPCGNYSPDNCVWALRRTGQTEDQQKLEILDRKYKAALATERNGL